MRFLVRAFTLLLVLAALGGGIGWYLAGREPGPSIVITSPTGFVGQASTLAFSVEAPRRELSRLEVTIEQNGVPMPVMTLADLATDEGGDGDRLIVTRPVGKKTQPALANGPARIVIAAARPVFFGLRTAEATTAADVQVRLDPPRVAVLSVHHYINLGGAEFVVMRATPEDVQAGVRVGDAEYPAYPGAAVGIADPAVRVAFFALRHDQDVNATISAFARDAAGNQATAPVERRPFVKTFVRSRIPIDQGFLDRVVPAITAETEGLDLDTSTPESRLKAFLVINGELREKNAEAIRQLAGQTRPEMLWRDAFAQLGNTQVESRFADQRTYYFGDDEIDRQVHLGFDLASVQQAPVHVANTGMVVFADYLGIYGNCVIVDHGLGIQSLYAHLSSMAVKAGDRVEKGAELGRTGVTGLAGGDHLHFTMLLNGTPVNPVEWWDGHWMEDRVFRKIREAGGTR